MNAPRRRSVRQAASQPRVGDDVFDVLLFQIGDDEASDRLDGWELRIGFFRLPAIARRAARAACLRYGGRALDWTVDRREVISIAGSTIKLGPTTERWGSIGGHEGPSVFR